MWYWYVAPRGGHRAPVAAPAEVVDPFCGVGRRGVLRLMLGRPDDARIVLRASPRMAPPEWLDPQHPGPEPASQPVQRGAGKPAAPDHDRLVMRHRRSLPAR
jgi:hypothetical protein